MSASNRSWLLAVGMAVGLAASCSGDHTVAKGRAGSGGTGGSSGGAGGSSADGGMGAVLSEGGLAMKRVTALAVNPPSVTIEVQDGTSSPVTLTAVATYDDGSSGPVTAAWQFDRADLAMVDGGTGTVTARGNRGGKGAITATASGIDASGEVVVKLHLTSDTVGLAQPQKDAFASPDATPSATILYPYEGTVFGQGLLPPEMMWSGGNTGDVYKIDVKGAFFDMVAYTYADDQRWTMPEDPWTQFTKSTDGLPSSVTVQRMSGAGQAHAPTVSSWTVADGSLLGTIYYWAVSQGQVVKINPGAKAPVPAFDPGPNTALGTPEPPAYTGKSPPWADQGAGKRCVACHTVSRDGSTLVAAFHNGGEYPWGRVDTATEAIEYVAPYQTPSVFGALTPNGSHLVYDQHDFTLHLADGPTGAPIASLLDSFTAVGHPQYSADGKMMAFVSNISGANVFEFSRSDLDVVDFDAGTAAFSNRRTVQPGGTEEIAFPSFTPDGQWIVYQRGDYSRARYGASQDQTGRNDLFMTTVPASGAGTQVHLGKASGVGALPPKDLKRNYQPRVAPLPVGGYFWVVFVSPRDYGNRMASTQDSTIENRKQLWVAAIDANPQPGADPSHPAFWLPGQDLSTINMDGYWAFEPCLQDGAPCSAGFECCSGYCRDTGTGELLCVPPTNDCSALGEACTMDADCCDPSLKCIGGFCSRPGPK